MHLISGLTLVAVLTASCGGDSDDSDDNGSREAAAPTSTSPTESTPESTAESESPESTAAPVASTSGPTPPTPSEAPPSAGATVTTGLTVNGTATTTPVPAPPPAPVGSVALRLTEIARLDGPTAFAAHPVSGVSTITERVGRVVQVTDAGEVTVVLDLRERVGSGSVEQGLLGLAYAPDGAHLYVDYTDRSGDTRVSEFRLVDGATADPASERVVLAVDQPFANHNGGQLAFGPDGMLYIALGDGGSQGDPDGNGQRLDALLGKILRIDPRAAADGSAPYTIPTDNPFASGSAPDGSLARPEIWAFGLRNPWRFSFDRQTGDLFIADVGGGLFEEVDWQAAGSGGGQNYGWVNVEGPREARAGGAQGTVLPIAFHAHGDGWCSITGGFVYRGSAIAGLAGTYVYSDFCRQQVTGLRIGPTGAVVEGPADIGVTASNVSSFGENLDGELYVMSLNGPVYRLEAG